MSNVDALLEELEATYAELHQVQVRYELLRAEVYEWCFYAFVLGAAVASGLWMLLTK